MNSRCRHRQRPHPQRLSRERLYRPEEDASGFVLLSEVVPDVILEMRYYSTYNFVGERIDGYEQPVALLTVQAAKALRAVSDEVAAMGYRLKVYDAYRPQTAVTQFMRWAQEADDTRMQAYFYPETEKSALFSQGYIAERSGHSRGSTVDLTLFELRTGREVDMGGTFDYFGARSHADFSRYQRRAVGHARAAARCDGPARLPAVCRGVVAFHIGK